MEQSEKLKLILFKEGIGVTDQHSDKDEKKGLSRRQFLKNTGMVAGGVVGGSLLGGLLTNEYQKKQEAQIKEEAAKGAALQEARMFFSRKEDFDILGAATERLFPQDDIGPGAIELGVPYFIDKQLASYWGTNAKEYMRDPFRQNSEEHDYQHKDSQKDKTGPNTDSQTPVPTPRYQSRLTRAEIFIAGLRKMEQVSRNKFKKKFVDASPDQQDQVLKMFENGKVEMQGVDSVTFFNLLLKTTIEGVYSDPLYGGNKNMQGWKMKEYPGPRASFADVIEAEDFVKMDLQSLKDYQKFA